MKVILQEKFQNMLKSKNYRRLWGQKFCIALNRNAGWERLIRNKLYENELFEKNKDKIRGVEYIIR